MILFQFELLLVNIRIKSAFYMMSMGSLGCVKVSISFAIPMQDRRRLSYW